MVDNLECLSLTPVQFHGCQIKVVLLYNIL